MALAGNVVVGDAIAEGVVTVLQKSSDDWAEAVITMAAAARMHVKLKETILWGCTGVGDVSKGLPYVAVYKSLVQSAKYVSSKSEAGPAEGAREDGRWRGRTDGFTWRVGSDGSENGRASGSVRVWLGCWLRWYGVEWVVCVLDPMSWSRKENRPC